MSPPVIRLHQEPTLKQRKRQAPKGRGLDPQALQEVQGLLGNASRSSDELIELGFSKSTNDGVWCFGPQKQRPRTQ